MYGQDKNTVRNNYKSVDFYKAIAFEGLEGAKMKFKEQMRGGNS